MKRTLFPAVIPVLFLPAAAQASDAIPVVSPWLTLPFILLLGSIALGPFINRHWWERYYAHVSIGLGFLVFSAYSLRFGMHRMAETGMEYASFIILIGSLYVASSGIYLHTERRATPLGNTALLAAGAVIANLLGTTGASMLLIRPFIRMNRARMRGYHVAFFVFLVSNIGGALTPVGDPPLFLGYLEGVPFHWTIITLWPIWLTATGAVLGIFFVVDSLSHRRWVAEGHAPVAGSKVEVMGTQNFVFLLIILAAVFAKPPAREIIMLAAAFAAHRFARKEALRANEFSFAPIREVAVLFAGIFATMVPALDWLSANAGSIGIRTPGQFYWASGVLSSILDNAPTYLNFLAAAMGLHGLSLGDPSSVAALIADHGKYLEAISAGAVFFGAMTYIGNGPNFMVKSIAENAGVPCPSFVGYVLRYSLPVLFPVFTLVWLIFFR